MKNWWLRTCADLQKNISQICDFRFFSFDSCTDIILKQLNKIKNMFFFVFFTFHFSLLFPVLFPPLCFPIVVPVVLPRCTTPLLGRSPRANRCENWWLRTCAHLQKNISKICDFRFFSFDLCTGIILKQFNKKNLNIFFSLFIFLCCFSCFFFPLCFPIVVPVVLPRCSPHCGATGTAEATGNCSLSFSTNTRARVGAKRSPRLVALGSPPGGDTTRRYNGETQRGNLQNGQTKRETK